MSDNKTYCQKEEAYKGKRCKSQCNFCKAREPISNKTKK